MCARHGAVQHDQFVGGVTGQCGGRLMRGHLLAGKSLLYRRLGDREGVLDIRDPESGYLLLLAVNDPDSHSWNVESNHLLLH